MMSDQQILSVLQDILAARRELCGRGFADRTETFRAEFGSKMIFALSKHLEMGTVTFIGLNYETETATGELPVGVQVIAHDHGFAPEVREFLRGGAPLTVADALACAHEFGSRLSLESVAA